MKIPSGLFRLGLFIIGWAVAVFLLVYSIRWEDLGFEFALFGQDITPYLFATILVFLGLLSGTMLKSAILGEWRVD